MGRWRERVRSASIPRARVAVSAFVSVEEERQTERSPKSSRMPEVSRIHSPRRRRKGTPFFIFTGSRILSVMLFSHSPFPTLLLSLLFQLSFLPLVFERSIFIIIYQKHTQKWPTPLFVGYHCSVPSIPPVWDVLLSTSRNKQAQSTIRYEGERRMAGGV